MSAIGQIEKTNASEKRRKTRKIRKTTFYVLMKEVIVILILF